MKKAQHQLHARIGSIIKTAVRNHSDCQVILDAACTTKGKGQQISLYADTKDSSINVVRVDAAIIKHNKVIAIVEIEESGRIPSRLYAKFFSAYSCNKYMRGTDELSLSERLRYCQVYSAAKFEENTSRLRNWAYNAENIKKFLKAINASKGKNRRAWRYEYFSGTTADFAEGSEDHLKLVEFLTKAL